MRINTCVHFRENYCHFNEIFQFSSLFLSHHFAPALLEQIMGTAIGKHILLASIWNTIYNDAIQQNKCNNARWTSASGHAGHK